MKQVVFIKRILFFLGFLLSIDPTYAGLPLWTFTPLTATTISVPSNSSATIQYQVTNQSRKSHTLSMQSIQGISQDSSSGHCANPFKLGYQQSCTLTLTVDGSALSGHVTGGPVVCEQGNTLQCYQPSQANNLSISLGSATSANSNYKYIYFTNYGNNTVTQCNIDNENGLLNNCNQTDATFNLPYGVALDNNYGYVANSIFSSSVSQCMIDPSTGAFITSSCVSTGSGFFSAGSIALNNGYAFIESFTDDNISSCTVNPSTGNLTACSTSGSGFNEPQAGMAFNNTYIYVTNTGNSTVSKCEINSSTGSLFNCNTTGGAVFDGPSGIGIYNGYAYVANYTNNTVSFCVVNSSSGELSACASTGSFIGGSGLSGPNGVGVVNGYVYIENCDDNTVLRCIPNLATGELTACISTGDAFNCPAGQVAFY